MFAIRNKFIRILDSTLNKSRTLCIPMAVGLMLLGSPPVFADNAVKLKVLVITTGNTTQDIGFAYIQPILDEMGVPYDVLNATTQNLTTSLLSPNSCLATTAGCVGNYNGVILTSTDLAGSFTSAEWDILHAYETNFHVREAVLSGYPATYSDSGGIYLDYGLTYSSSPNAPYNATWTIPATYSKIVFDYVNTANPLPITDFAFAANPRNNAMGPKDGTIPSVIPLLKTTAGEALISIVQYKFPVQTTVKREVLVSTITNAWFLTHSQVQGYEFVNWATQGVFLGGRFVYMSNHLDDLFLENDQWDVTAKKTNSALTYRLTDNDVTNAVSKQAAFRTAHPTAGTDFKLDFAFNGAGAVIDPAATTPQLNSVDALVQAVMANKTQFRFISHTFSHADMDKSPVPANASCDYTTFTTIAPIQAEISKNRSVWGLLGLPEQAENNRVLVTGNHSGLKDRKCTDDVQDDDVPFWQGANPLFLTAAANLDVRYLASDTSQLNQDTEQFITNAMVNDGSATDRLILPRWPTNLFYNVRNPTQLVSEYNYIFRDRYLNAGQNPCNIAGAICTARTYAQILTAEADTALQHMLSFKKYPHFFHQGNVAKYDTAGNTLQFDWLNAVYTAYEKLFKLPVKNFPYYKIGDMTNDRLLAKSATINATWNREPTSTVTLSANKTVNLLVTGLQNSDPLSLYGNQFVGTINVSTTPQTISVAQAQTQSNRPPVAVNDSLTTTANTPVNFTAAQLLANDSDPDSNPLSISNMSATTNGGTISGNYTYTPASGFSGTDTFTYTISDGQGETATATVTVTVNAAPVNRSPVAVNDSLTTTANTPVNFTAAQLLANDSDPDSNPLTISSVSAPAHGTITGNYTYTPTNGYTGSDTFTYSISDGQGGTATATVTVTVNATGITPAKYFPQAVTILTGKFDYGTMASFTAADSNTYDIKSTYVAATVGGETDWYGKTVMTGSPSALTQLTVTYKGQYSKTNVTQQLYLYNFTTNSWELFDTRSVGNTTDATITATISSNPQRFVSASGEIRARVRGFRAGAQSTTNWVFYSWANYLAWDVK